MQKDNIRQFWNEYKKSDYFKQKDMIKKLDISFLIESVKFKLSCDEKIAENIVVSIFQGYFNDILN